MSSWYVIDGTKIAFRNQQTNKQKTKQNKTEKTLCSWKPQSGEKIGQTLAHRELEAKLQKQVSWVERPKPAIASSLSPPEGQDGDGWGLYFLYTGPWGFREEIMFIFFMLIQRMKHFLVRRLD